MAIFDEGIYDDYIFDDYGGASPATMADAIKAAYLLWPIFVPSNTFCKLNQLADAVGEATVNHMNSVGVVNTGVGTHGLTLNSTTLGTAILNAMVATGQFVAGAYVTKLANCLARGIVNHLNNDLPNLATSVNIADAHFFHTFAFVSSTLKTRIETELVADGFSLSGEISKLVQSITSSFETYINVKPIFAVPSPTPNAAHTHTFNYVV